MSVFQAFDPRAELFGQSFLAITDAMAGWPAMRELTQTIFKRYGFDDIQADKWYPMQLALDVFRDVGIKLGSGMLHKIGKHVPENALFPPDITSVEAALRSINVAYHMNHRGGEIGSYMVDSVQPQQIQMTCHNPYPCDFDHGLIEAMARRFAPKGASVTITHHPARPCRKQGQDRCSYLVTWKAPR